MNQVEIVLVTKIVNDKEIGWYVPEVSTYLACSFYFMIKVRVTELGDEIGLYGALSLIYK